MRTIRLAILTLTILFTISVANTDAQTPDMQPELLKQVPARLPKLALLGAVAETKGGVPYHKIVLTITNWEKYDPDMFVLPIGKRFTGGSCGEVKARIVVLVYSERGTPLSGCVPMSQPADLSTFSFLIRKGSSVPKFIYAVMNDQSTGAVYRSNLVSPFGGETK
jgi:hypothetical protein